MNRIGLISGYFQHAYSSTLWKKPTHFEWSKENIEDTTCFVDSGIVPNINTKCKRKFAWVVESSTIIPNVVNDIIQNYKAISDSYEFLISHDKRIYGLADNFYYLPPHGYWIEHPQIYPKTKLCSMISSAKQFCAGHRYRLDWAQKLYSSLDLFGRDIRTFDKKEDVLNDYYFSVTIENSAYKKYWSEKILDCFATGTIPIYHGDPDIGDNFNMDGVIILTDNFNVNQLSPELYYSKIDAIKDNFNRALQYNVIEDIIWDKFLK